MSNKNKQIMTLPLNKGIKRDQPFGNEGELEDCMNAHYKHGALRPVARGKYYAPNPGYDKITRHKTANFDNWIGYDSATRRLIHFTVADSATVQEILVLNESETLNDIEVLKNYLLIATSERLYKYLHINDTYTRVDINLKIAYSLRAYDHEIVQTIESETDHGTEAVVADIYTKMNTKSQDGLLTGAISHRAAYKLIDGTYLMTTAPQITVPGGINLKSIFTDAADRDMWLDGLEGWHGEDKTDATGGKIIRFVANKWKVILSPSYYSALEQEKNIISSLCIFFSKPLLKYDIDQTLTYDDDATNWLGNIANEDPGVEHYFWENDAHILSDDWINIAEPEAGWFLVAEIPFGEIIDGVTTIVDTDNYLKTKNWYQNYASHTQLPIDQGTHHAISCDQIWKYNSRLWLTGLSKTMAQQIIGLMTPNLPADRTAFGFISFFDIKIIAQLTIDNQTVYTESNTKSWPFRNDGTNHEIILPMITYPDARVDKYIIYVNHAGNWKELAKLSATASRNYNYSYYIDVNTATPFSITSQNKSYMKQDTNTELFFRLTKNLSSLPIVTTFPASTVNDESLTGQVQLSEVNNPFVFPANLNYVIGTGSILDFASNTDVLSEGQFGQFPVHVFTSEGIYTLTLGSGATIIQNITPLSPDILVGKSLSTSNGIFYCTSEGIMVLNNRNPVCISKALEGNMSPIYDHPQFQLYSSHPQVVELGSIITDKTEFLDDIENILFGFDSVNKRLICTNDALNCSYVYNIDSGTWSRLSESYSYFIQNYPVTIAQCTRGLIALSDTRSDTNNVQVHFHTKIINAGSDLLKLIDESVLRCNIENESGKYSAFALFASNDKVKWALITGNDRKSRKIDDIQLSYGHSAYKYFIFAFWGELKPDYDNVIEAIQAEVEIVNNDKDNRLRSW